MNIPNRDSSFPYKISFQNKESDKNAGVRALFSMNVWTSGLRIIILPTILNMPGLDMAKYNFGLKRASVRDEKQLYNAWAIHLTIMFKQGKPHFLTKLFFDQT